jgi:D-inositol-3-phosphate glycosyltransferase
LSGIAGHRLKHEWSLPLLMTFHTLERVKAETFAAESRERADAEQALFGCTDAVLASCDVEAAQCVALYGADPERVHIVPLGVERALFAPGYRPQARRALGLDTQRPLLLFAGRIQELKGVTLALETLIALRDRGRDAQLAIVGGPSGPSGRATLAALHEVVAREELIDRVLFVAPQSHVMLSTWYRAADVTLVPSYAESFGLVALESAACGTPVVASAVGGLTTLVRDDANGYLVPVRDAGHWADAVERVLDPERALRLSNEAVLGARSYTWRAAGQRVVTIVERLSASTLLRC